MINYKNTSVFVPIKETTINIDILTQAPIKIKKLAERIIQELPQKVDNESKPAGKYLRTIQYSQLSTWSVDFIGISTTLGIFADKINYMILKGDGCNVQPMINRIILKGIKKQTKPNKNNIGEFLGYGHFRWNHHGCYTFTEKELEIVKNYFEVK